MSARASERILVRATRAHAAQQPCRLLLPPPPRLPGTLPAQALLSQTKCMAHKAPLEAKRTIVVVVVLNGRLQLVLGVRHHAAAGWAILRAGGRAASAPPASGRQQECPRDALQGDQAVRAALHRLRAVGLAKATAPRARGRELRQGAARRRKGSARHSHVWCWHVRCVTYRVRDVKIPIMSAFR